MCQVDIICNLTNLPIGSPVYGYISHYTYGGSVGSTISNSQCHEEAVCVVSGYGSYTIPTGNTIAPQQGNCYLSGNSYCCEVECEGVVIGTICGIFAVPPQDDNSSPNSLVATPNPFNDYLNLRFISPSKQATLSLVNTTGQVILTKKVQVQQGENYLNIDLNDIELSKGLYIVMLQFENGNSISTKVIYQN